MGKHNKQYADSYKNQYEIKKLHYARVGKAAMKLTNEGS